MKERKEDSFTAQTDEQNGASEKSSEYSLPTTAPQWMLGFGGGLLLLVALTMLIVCTCALWNGLVSAAIPGLFFSVGFGWLGILLLRCQLTRVAVGREMIRLYQFGRLKLELPMDDVKVYLVGNLELGGLFYCLCPYTVEELAAFREKQLKKGAVTRSELPFRKRMPDWQRIFAHEYLKRSIFWGLRDLSHKGLVFLGNTLEIWSLLQWRFAQNPPCVLADTPPDILRTQNRKCEKMGGGEAIGSGWALTVVFGSLLAATIVAMLTMRWEAIVLPALLGTFLLFLVLGYWLCPKGEPFSPCPEGIRFLGRKSGLLPADRIKIIAKAGYMLRNGMQWYLVITEHGIDELAQRESQILRRTKSGCRRLEFYDRLPNGNELLFRRYCSRKLTWGGNEKGTILMAAYSPDREAKLRALYPDAQ